VLGGPVKAKREPGQALLRTIVEIVLEPLPLGVSGLDQPGAGGAEPPRERLSLRDHGGQAERRKCRHGDVELGTEDAVGDQP
jgi:hypothetical protein